jgi:RNA polymerase sigma-70 factor (ECF subfamily)
LKLPLTILQKIPKSARYFEKVYADVDYRSENLAFRPYRSHILLNAMICGTIRAFLRVQVGVDLLPSAHEEWNMGYDDQTDMGGSREAFLTTQWSLIENIKADLDRDKTLIDFLLRQYWKPVYCYLRRKGYDNEHAKDLTQDFFHEVVLNRDMVGRADQTRGRFRSFLLFALNEYLTKQNIEARARKRIPKGKLVSLEVAEAPTLPQSVERASAEESYHYAWLSALLERVLADVRAECRRQGMETHYVLFYQRIVRPIMSGQSPKSLTDLSRKHGVSDAKRASNMIVTVKRRFRTALMQHIRHTLLSGDQASEEMEELLQYLPKSAQHFK